MKRRLVPLYYICLVLTLPVAMPKAATGRVPPEAGISTILLAVVAVRVFQFEKMWPWAMPNIKEEAAMALYAMTLA